MKNNKAYFLFLLLVLAIYSTSSYAADKSIIIEKLKVEYREQALGVDTKKPRFSWQMFSEGRGVYQTAYRISVTDENRQKVWDSGKVNSDISLNIEYAGAQLNPCTKYNWDITVWDQKKKRHTASSQFETGLMNEKDEGWSGARWIGGDDKSLPLYSQYLPVFRISYSLLLDKASQSTKASFIYGANDIRLMDKHKNLYNLENKKDDSYIQVELDLNPLPSGGNAQLNIYRIGFHPNDKKDKPLASYPIPLQIIHPDNMYDTHTIYINTVLGYTEFYINGNAKSEQIAKLNLNPLGQGGDFIAFPVLGDIGFSVPSSTQASFSAIEVRNHRSPSNALYTEPDIQTIDGGADGVFLTKSIDRNSMPMLRTTFQTNAKTIKKARLYVTSRGIYEMYINGQRVGNDYFNPGLSQYNKTHFYQTYDVTPYLTSGKNAMGAILGEGWWSGESTFMGEFWNFFGDRQSLLAKLLIRYEDGSEDIIVSHPDTWTYYNKGPVVYSSFFQGEVYDAQKEQDIKGWSLPEYIEKDWTKASEVSLVGTINCDSANLVANMPLVSDYSQMQYIGNIDTSPQKVKEITAVSMNEIRPGVYIYDMGQNMAGVPKIMLSGQEPGKEIRLRFAEVLYPDLPEYKDKAGMLMLENIRAAMAQDIYISKGGNEIINPSFTFHGYRYIEISGIPAPLALEQVKSEVISSIHAFASSYITSNPKVNKLWENITWSTLANFLSIPTDCPQRNERLGWSGDISVFSRTATYLADVPQFLSRHMRAMRDVQRQDGRFPDIAPIGGGFGGILWGSAGITVAWESYQQYHDKQMLIEHYDAMKSYIDYLSLQIDPTTHIMGNKYRRNWGSLGDWLSPEYDKSEKSLLWEAYFIYDLELMRKIARVLEKQEDADRYEALRIERKAFFNDTYIDKETGKTVFPDKAETGQKKLVDTQVSYVLPFAFDILDNPNKEKVLDNFVSTITRSNKADNGTECLSYSLMTGFIGTAWINKALSDNGNTEAAYRLLQQTTYPSWLYSVEQGATTIWERLNSYTHTDGFGGNNRMNSFNHYSFGAVASWMYNYSLGIERDESSPGFKHFLLKPEPDPTGQMTFAQGHYDSMYGRIESEWQVEGETCRFQFTIPANTTASLLLEAHPDNITENGKPLKSVKGVKSLGLIHGKQAFELPSGKHNIVVRNYIKK
ncbi:glycoside hydrolase family 78 protein [Bacteroidales bacterium OttesenSCG-928-L03]|nr:glycoside hydrolase family 78 protein [Bacteroidales bacterium OttesenSCG-928-L03]